MNQPQRQITAKAGPIGVAIVGASAAATGSAVIIVSLGVAVGIGLIGYGAYKMMNRNSDKSDPK